MYALFALSLFSFIFNVIPAFATIPHLTTETNISAICFLMSAQDFCRTSPCTPRVTPISTTDLGGAGHICTHHTDPTNIFDFQNRPLLRTLNADNLLDQRQSENIIANNNFFSYYSILQCLMIDNDRFRLDPNATTIRYC